MGRTTTYRTHPRCKGFLRMRGQREAAFACTAMRERHINIAQEVFDDMLTRRSEEFSRAHLPYVGGLPRKMMCFAGGLQVADLLCRATVGWPCSHRLAGAPRPHNRPTRRNVRVRRRLLLPFGRLSREQSRGRGADAPRS
jgi:hypothetical protein